jgi:hypothetical protein
LWHFKTKKVTDGNLTSRNCPARGQMWNKYVYFLINIDESDLKQKTKTNAPELKADVYP